VPYYRTPAPQTNVLDSDGLIELTGNYTFPDANMNGISDTWEQQFFGGTNQVHTCQTDADGDGFSDCAEFIAGTNPTNALSHLRLYPPSAQPNFKVLFQWPTVPGRIYQLQSTYDFEHWIEFSPWMRANNNTLSIIRSAPEPGDPYAYRVEVRP
jgi:hypothetical protein